MSVADRLGTGSSFAAPRARSARGRAKALVQGDIPVYELTRYRLEQVAATPLNPRRNFGTPTQLTEFGEALRKKQLAACVVVSRGVYLGLWPEHTDEIGDAEVVLLNGERRWRSARHVGLEALDFVVRDDLAPTREEFVDNLLQENLDREDFDVIERARGVAQLVDECGDQVRAAERLRRDKSWVTNQLALLRLPEEIQSMLAAGTLPERDGRVLARYSKNNPDLAPGDLLAHLEQLKADEARKKDEDKALLAEAKKSRELSADNSKSGEEEAGPRGQLSADNRPPAPRQPVNDHDGQDTAAGRQLPGGSGAQAKTVSKPPPSRLSADNRSRATPADVTSSATEAVKSLADAPKELAAVLGAALTPEELVALIEELHALV